MTDVVELKLRDVPAAPGRGFLPGGQSGASSVEELRLYFPAASESQVIHCPLLLMLQPPTDCGYCDLDAIINTCLFVAVLVSQSCAGNRKKPTE